MSAATRFKLAVVWRSYSIANLDFSPSGTTGLSYDVALAGYPQRFDDIHPNTGLFTWAAWTLFAIRSCEYSC